MTHSIILILVTLAIVALIDYLPRIFVVSRKPLNPTVNRGRIPDYLIMPTVYGNISYLQNVPFLRKYAAKVVICTSLYETEGFYRDLDAVCAQYGFRYIKADLPMANGQPIKNAYTIYKGAFENFTETLGVSNTTPCILIDADTYSNDNVNTLVRTFQANSLDIASLRCEVSKPQTLIETLQDFEYTLAMDNRRTDPWLTSGACNMATAGTFKQIFANHSHFFAGGDIEIGKIAQVMGFRLRHIRFTFYTAAPDTFKGWFNQRIIWFAGGVRHHVINIASYGWHHFFILFYNSLLIYLLLPLRWIELINFPFTLVALIGLSWIYTAILIIGKKRWRPAYLVLPFYAFIQSMFILPLGFVRYAKLAWKQRSFGMLSYQLDGLTIFNRSLNRTLSIASAGVIIYVAVAFTAVRITYWMQHGIVFHTLLQ